MTSRAKPSKRENWRWKHVQPCGTDAAYERHVYHGEIPCEPCTAAHAAASRERRRARKAQEYVLTSENSSPQTAEINR